MKEEIIFLIVGWIICSAIAYFILHALGRNDFEAFMLIGCIIASEVIENIIRRLMKKK